MSEVDRLEAAMNECREMVREAHAATKDLRAAVREAMTMGPGARRVAAGFAATGGVVRGADLIEQRLLRGFLPPAKRSVAPEAG